MARETPKPQEISDDADLSQYGERSSGESFRFRDRTRAEVGETDISLILGRVSAEEAARLVTKTCRPYAAVRHTTAGQLRGKGFYVRHTPTRKNSQHVSVTLPQKDEHAEWDDNLAKIFDQCFADPRGVEG
jgi:hypothetical protein